MPIAAPLTDAQAQQLQANILKSHGRDYAVHLFLQFDAVHRAGIREWLKLLNITDAFTQLEDTRRFKELLKLSNTKGMPFGQAEAEELDDLSGKSLRTVYFTATGLVQLGFQLGGFEKSFIDGMKTSKRVLSDPDPEKWEFSRSPAQDISAMLLVACSDLEKLNVEVNTLIAGLPPGVAVVHKQRGEVLHNEHGIGIEHFGYADGVSQPRLVEHDTVVAKVWDDNMHPLDVCLFSDPLVTGTGDAFASYFVFRKLAQDVKGFKDAEEGLGLGERGGALAVGRFEDGTLVTRHAEEQGIKDEAELQNDFDYATDKEGSRCPYHAHIRAVNPRVTIDGTVNARIVRRGMPYDEAGRNGDLNWHPDGKVGLLFMCFQKSIQGQFELIQGMWANKGDLTGLGINKRVAIDPIIGQGNNRRQQQYPVKWDEDIRQHRCNIKGFVTLKGGDYFYAPSITFIHNL